MLKNLFVLLLCLGLGGCASYQYGGIYNQALKAKAITVITKEKNLKGLRERIVGYFKTQGYTNVVYHDHNNSFFVFAKEGEFEQPCEIILKYTQKPGIDKIRIELLDGDDDLITDEQVSDDIQAIAWRIKSY